MKKKIYLILIFSAVIAYVVICYQNGLSSLNGSLEFQPKLSAYKLFKGSMADLSPAKDVQLYELSSTLFTDHAEKQRLIRLPAGKQMRTYGNGLPEFPEETILAKTFYYSTTINKRRKLIETRLLILRKGQWNAATYQWTTDQKDALLLTSGANVPVDFADPDGKNRSISYRIPAQSACGSCHRNGSELIPIGPKLRNLNMEVIREGKKIGQLSFLAEKGLINKTDRDTVGAMPDYHDQTKPLDQRARAYFAMNCSHCHQPGGLAGNLSLNLSYTTDYAHTGIAFNKQNIVERVAAMGPFHMPKTGTTIIDDKGVALLIAYIKGLPKR